MPFGPASTAFPEPIVPSGVLPYWPVSVCSVDKCVDKLGAGDSGLRSQDARARSVPHRFTLASRRTTSPPGGGNPERSGGAAARYKHALRIFLESASRSGHHPASDVGSDLGGLPPVDNAGLWGDRRIHCVRAATTPSGPPPSSSSWTSVASRRLAGQTGTSCPASTHRRRQDRLLKMDALGPSAGRGLVSLRMDVTMARAARVTGFEHPEMVARGSGRHRFQRELGAETESVAPAR